MLAFLALPMMAVAVEQARISGGGANGGSNSSRGGSGSDRLPPQLTGTYSTISPAENLAIHQRWKFYLRRASDSLDQVSKKLEEYGTATMSSPILAPAGGNFKFNMSMTPLQFYSDAKANIEGSAASQLEISQALTGVATFSNTAAGAASLPNITGTTTGNAAASVPLDGGGQLAPYTPLLSSTQNDQIPDRAALITAAGDSATQSLLNFLGDPGAAAQFKDQVVFVSVVNVSVNPGWRSKKDFAAQVTVKADYDYTVARPSLLEKIVALDDAATVADNALVSATTAAVLADAIASDPAAIKADAAVTDGQAQVAVDTAAVKAASDALTSGPATYGKLKKAADDAEAYANIVDTLLAAAKKKAKGPPSDPAAANDVKQLQAQADVLVLASDNATRDAEQFDPNTLNDALNRAKVNLAVDQIALANAIGVVRNERPKEIATDAGKFAPGSDLEVAKAKAIAAASASTFTSAAAYAATQEAAEQKAAAADEAVTRLQPCVVAQAKYWIGCLGSGSNDLPIGPCTATGTNDANPLVAGVSPMTDSQVLDTQDQFRRQDALTLQMMAALQKANLGGQANLLEHYFQQRQKDAQGVSNNGVVNTFSCAGGIFGFEIGPRFKALADPASRKGGSANILDRQSFPAMLIVGVDQQDILPRLGTCNGHAVVVEPEIKFTQTTQWMPLTHVIFSWGDIFSPGNWHAPRFSENTRMDIMLELRDAMDALKNFDHENACRFEGDRNSNPPSSDYASYREQYDVLKDRYTTDRYLIDGDYSFASLPAELDIPAAAQPKTTTVVGVTPATIAVEADGNEVIKAAPVSKTLYLFGSNLDLANGLAVTSTNSDENPDTSPFSINAAFADTSGTAGATAPNANFRPVKVTFDPNSNNKMPQFVSFNLQLQLDPSKVTASAAGSTPPPTSPAIVFYRKEPDQGLKPVASSTVVTLSGAPFVSGTQVQTISVNPSQSDNAVNIGGDAIYHKLDQPGIPVPHPVNSVNINPPRR